MNRLQIIEDEWFARQQPLALRSYAEKWRVAVVRESGKQTPPAEEKLRALATELDSDQEVLLALAGRLPADVVSIIQEHPK